MAETKRDLCAAPDVNGQAGTEAGKAVMQAIDSLEEYARD